MLSTAYDSRRNVYSEVGFRRQVYLVTLHDVYISVFRTMNTYIFV